MSNTQDVAWWQAAHPRLFTPAPAARLRIWGWCVGYAAVLAFGLWWIDASPARLWHGLSRLGFLIRLMLPPSTGGVLPLYLAALGQTLAMAFFGTVLAVLFAVPIGFLAARNILPNWLAHFTLRRTLDVFRGIDILIWALIFVSAVGMGPFAGVLAIVFSDIAFLAKIYAEAIENVDKGPLEGARAAGANGLQVIRVAVVPQVLPSILGNALYFLESNIRAATVLGVVGAGGIGLQLSQQIFVNNWDQACFLIIMMLVTVALMAKVTRTIRMRFIGAGR